MLWGGVRTSSALAAAAYRKEVIGLQVDWRIQRLADFDDVDYPIGRHMTLPDPIPDGTLSASYCPSHRALTAKLGNDGSDRIVLTHGAASPNFNKLGKSLIILYVSNQLKN
jgi:hypothetical protein